MSNISKPREPRSFFVTDPVVPAVAIPCPGEILGSWLSATAARCECAPEDYLAYLGVPRPRARSLVKADMIVPSTRLLRALRNDTGIEEDVLRQMTFADLKEPQLLMASMLHCQPCRACTEAASAVSNRQVRLLNSRAPWRIVCPEHPLPNETNDIARNVSIAGLHDLIERIVKFLDEAALNAGILGAAVPYGAGAAFTVATFLRFVHLLNACILVNIVEFDDMRDQALFLIRDVFSYEQGQAVALPLRRRNCFAVSLVLAWQLTLTPVRTLLTGVRTSGPPGQKNFRDLEQAFGLSALIREYWPAEFLNPLMVSGAWSRYRLAGDKRSRPTPLAVRMLRHLQNYPDYQHRLSEADWNHRTCTQHLINAPVSRVSSFPPLGPFCFNDVAASGHSASAIARARQQMWRVRDWRAKIRPWTDHE